MVCQYKRDELPLSSSLSVGAGTHNTPQSPRASGGGQYHLGHPREVFRHIQTLSELQAPAWGKEGGGGSLQEIVTNICEKMKSVEGKLERERGKRMEQEERLEQLKHEFCVAEEKAQQRERRVAKMEQTLEKNVQEVVSVRQTAGRAGPLAYGAGVKGGGWEGVGERAGLK